MSKDADIIVEFRMVGRALRVTAVCAVTGEEVTMVGDPSVPKEQLKALAARKLRYVQERKAKEAKQQGVRR